MQWNPASSDADHPAAWTSLRQAMLARNVTLAGLALGAVVVYQFLASALPGMVLAGAAVLFGALNLATASRLRRSWPVTEREVLAHIVFDVVALAMLFYFTGATAYPFVDLLLVPVAIAAARLARGHALAVALLALAAYLLLAAMHDRVGAWVSFAVCAGFVGCLVFGMASRSREHQCKLRQARQKSVNDDYLLRAGSLAAGAAHEIRSPLCTMAVLVNELLQRPDDAAGQAHNLRLMSVQIEVCRRIVSELMGYGQIAVDTPAQSAPVDRFIRDILEKWRLLRPGATLACRRQGAHPAPSIATDQGLGHAILNLLNNAADASPQAVEMVCTWTRTELRLQVLDRGSGIAPELSGFLGERFLTTKREKGTGIGLLLAKTAIERAGGRLKLENRSGGGVSAEIVVPIGDAVQTRAQPDAQPASESGMRTPALAVRYYHSQAGKA